MIRIALIIAIAVFSFQLGAQSVNLKKETFKVYGNCGMCKNKIENCLKENDGITSRKYDIKKQLLTVEYDPGKITAKEIGQKVADVGYDNAYARSTDEKYNKLHECCQYKRPKS
jgi:mercuric ion binding protein